jgi:hypothetical protein
MAGLFNSNDDKIDTWIAIHARKKGLKIIVAIQGIENRRKQRP